jgi:hypothetical protein
MSNDEGGTDDEEFRVAAVKDRVDTTLQVWMGITAGCAKCHSHKYDPISHEEYYQLFAIFNQTADNDAYDDAPVIRFESAEQAEELASLHREINELKERRGPNGADGSHTAAATADAPDTPLGNDKSNETCNIRIDREKLNAEIAAMEKRLQEVEATVTKLPIMRGLAVDKQRTTKIHLRGNFLEQGAEVSPGVPAAFGDMEHLWSRKAILVHRGHRLPIRCCWTGSPPTCATRMTGRLRKCARRL